MTDIARDAPRDNSIIVKSQGKLWGSIGLLFLLMALMVSYYVLRYINDTRSMDRPNLGISTASQMSTQELATSISGAGYTLVSEAGDIVVVELMGRQATCETDRDSLVSCSWINQR